MTGHLIGENDRSPDLPGFKYMDSARRVEGLINRSRGKIPHLTKFTSRTLTESWKSEMPGGSGAVPKIDGDDSVSTHVMVVSEHFGSEILQKVGGLCHC